MSWQYFKEYDKITAFLIAGVLGLAVETVVLVGLTEQGLNLYFSKLVAIEAAIISVFFVNDRFAFKTLEKKAYALIRTNIVRTGGTVLSFAGLFIGIDLGFHYVLANAFGVLIGSGFNYYFERVLTWESVQS